MKGSLLPPLSPTKDTADYPLLRGSISRWLWRIYTQRITPGGRWFILATAAFVAYGGASLQLQGYVPAVYAGAIWFIAMVGLLIYRPKVQLRARHSLRVCAGETLPIDIAIEQRGRWRGADLMVLPHRLPAAVDAVSDSGVALPDLKAGQRMQVQLNLRCTRRGAYLLQGFRVETHFPFGILRARRTFQDNRQLLVYPKFTPLAQLDLPTGRRYQPGGVALASEIGESFEYLGNREYRQGDNIRDIDWRATARVGRPIVREWLEEYMLRVAVVLDTHVPQNLSKRAIYERRDAFERAVSMAASVSDYMARQDYLVDIFAAGPDLYHLVAGRSLAYLDQILDILACVGESPKEPFEVIEPQIGELLARISTVICVMLDWNENRRAFVHRLHSQGAAVKVIILRDGPCTLDPRGEADVLGVVPILSRADCERGVEEL